MVTLIQFIVCLVILLVIITGYIWNYIQEKRDFNNGVCPQCGKSLVHFDNDSQGGQGWCCHNCNYFVWISWFKR